MVFYFKSFSFILLPQIQNFGQGSWFFLETPMVSLVILGTSHALLYNIINLQAERIWCLIRTVSVIPSYQLRRVLKTFAPWATLCFKEWNKVQSLSWVLTLPTLSTNLLIHFNLRHFFSGNFFLLVAFRFIVWVFTNIRQHHVGRNCYIFSTLWHQSLTLIRICLQLPLCSSF